MGREEAVADKETMRAGGHIGAESHAWVPVQGSRSGRRRLGADSRIGQLQEQVERVVTEVNGEPATRRVQRLQPPTAPQLAETMWGRATSRSALLFLVVVAAEFSQAFATSDAHGRSRRDCARAGQGASGLAGLGARVGHAAGYRQACPYDIVVGAGADLGPAAAEAPHRDSTIRLRGGDASLAEPNGGKASYSQAAAAGVEVPLNGNDVGTGAAANVGGEEQTMVLNVDVLKLEALRKLGASLRIGGEGTARRKFKAVRKKGGKMDDVKFQNALKKAGLNPVGDIETVEMHHEDGTIWTFPQPRLLTNQQANQFCVQGHYNEHHAAPETEAQLAAAEFDKLSDIEKLRRLAQADLAAGGSADDGEQADEGDAGVGEGNGEHSESAGASPEEILAREENDQAESEEEEGEEEGGTSHEHEDEADGGAE